MLKFEREVSKKLLKSLLADLPHRTGKSLDRSSKVFHKYQSLVVSLSQCGDSEFSFQSLLEIIDEVIKECQFYVSIPDPHSPVDNSLQSRIRPGDKAFKAVFIESLLVLFHLLILLLVLDLSKPEEFAEYRKRKGLDPDQIRNSGNFIANADFFHTFIYLVENSRNYTPVPKETAKYTLRLLVQVLSPHLTLCVVNHPYITGGINDQTEYLLSFSIYALAAFVHYTQPDVFDEHINDTVEATFDFTENPPTYTSHLYPEILSCQFLNVESVSANLRSNVDLILKLRSIEQRKLLIYLSWISISRAMYVRYGQASRWGEGMETVLRGIIKDLHTLPNIESPESAVEQVYICAIASLLPDEAEAKRIWKPYFDLQFKGLGSSDTDVRDDSLLFLMEFARLSHLATCDPPYRQKFPEVCHEISLIHVPLRDALFHREQTEIRSHRSKRQLATYNAVYSWLGPDTYYSTDLSTYASPAFFQSYFQGIFERIELGDVNVWEHFSKWQEYFVTMLCECCVFAGKIKEKKEEYSAAFICGTILFLRTRKFINYTGDKKKLELISAMYSNLDSFTLDARNKAMDVLIFIFQTVDDESFDTLLDVSNLLTDFLYAQAPALLDPKVSCHHWDLDYIHKLLVSRVKISWKISKKLSRAANYNHEEESRLRAGVLLALCDTNSATTETATDCMRLFSEEIVLRSNAEIDTDQTSNYIDYDIFKGILGTDSKSQCSSIQRMTNLHQHISGLSGVSETTRILYTSIRVFCAHYLCIRERTPDELCECSTSEVKKVTNHLILFNEVVWHMMLRSPEKSDQELVLPALVEKYESLFLVNDYVRNQLLSGWRVPFVDRPDLATMVLNYMFEHLFIPLSQRSFDDQDEKLTIALYSSGMILYIPRLIQICSESGRYRLDFDICDVVEKLMFFYEPYMLEGPYQKQVAKQLFRVVEAVAHAENLYRRPKYASLKSIISVTLNFLANQEPGQHEEDLMNIVCWTLPSLLTGFSLDVLSFESKEEVCENLDFFRHAVEVLYVFMKNFNENVDIAVEHDNETVAFVKEGLTQLFRSNPELAIIVGEDRATKGKDLLKICILDAFSLSGPNDNQHLDSDVARMEYMSTILTQNFDIVSAMCEVCPAVEVDNLALALVTFFGAKSRGLQIAEMAAEKEIQQARSANELFRRNSVFAKIVIQYMVTVGGSIWQQAFDPLIRQVIQSPVLFLSQPSQDGSTFEPSKATNKAVAEAASSFYSLPENKIPPSLVALTRFIWSHISRRFPESGFVGLRNLFLLRVACPIIIAPNDYDMVDTTLNQTQLKALVAVAKVLQKVNLDRCESCCTPGLAEAWKTAILHIRDAETSPDAALFGELQCIGDIDHAAKDLHKYLHRHGPEVRGVLLATEVNLDISAGFNSISLSKPSLMSTTPSIASSGSSITRGPSHLSSKGTSESPQKHIVEEVSDMDDSSINSCANSESSNPPVLSEVFTCMMRRLGPPYTFTVSSVRKNSVEMPKLATSNEKHTYRHSINQPFSNEPCHVGSTYWQGYRTAYIIGTGRGIANERLLIYRIFRATQDAMRSDSDFGEIALLTHPFVSVERWLAIMDRLFAIAPPQTFERCKRFVGYCFPYNYVQYIKDMTSYDKWVIGKESEILPLEAIDEKDIRSLGLPEDIITPVLKDFYRATKFEKVLLKTSTGVDHFDVYVGREYVIIRGEVMGLKLCQTTDVIPKSSISVSKDVVDFHLVRSEYSARFTMNRRDCGALYRKLWEHKARPTTVLNELPLLQLSSNEAAAKLLFLSLVDLCCPKNQSLRESAYRLLVTLPARFSLKFSPQFDTDKQLHLAIPQVARVIKISRFIAEKHSELTIPILKSFLDAIPLERSPRQQVVLCRIMEPWTLNLSEVLRRAKRNELAEVASITNTLLSMLSVDGSLCEVITSHIWPVIVAQEDVFTVIIDVWIQYAIEEVFKKRRGIETRYSSLFATPMPLSGVKHLFERLYHTLDMEVSYSITTWTQHPNWVNIEVIISLLSNAILGSSKDITEVLPDICFVISAFCGAGPSSCRHRVHKFVVNVLDKMLCSDDFDQANRHRVESLRTLVTSTRGEVLFGAQMGVHDDAYDQFDRFSAEDMTEISKMVAEIMFVSLGQADLPIYRRATAAILMKYAGKVYPALQRKCILGIRGLYRGDMQDCGVNRAIDIFAETLATCRCPKMIHSYGEAFLLLLSDMAASLGVSSAYPRRLLWFSLSLLSIRVVPLYTPALLLLENTLRYLEVRSSFGTSGLQTQLMTGNPSGLNDWWLNHGDLLTALIVRQNFTAAIVETLVPGLQRSTTTHATLSVCQRILETCARFSAFHNQLQRHREDVAAFRLMLYLGTQNARDLSALPDMTHPLAVVDDGKILDDFRIEISETISYESDLTIVTLIDACSVTAFSSSMSFTLAGPRLINLICGLSDRRVIRMIAPLLRPTLDRLLALDDPEVNRQLVSWTQILFSHDIDERHGLETLLERAKEALKNQDRPPTITDDYQLIPTKFSEAITSDIQTALAELCQVIRLP